MTKRGMMFGVTLAVSSMLTIDAAAQSSSGSFSSTIESNRVAFNGGLRSGFQNIPTDAEPSPVSVHYVERTGLYCVSKRSSGSRIDRTRCRTADDWNRSGLLVNPVG